MKSIFLILTCSFISINIKAQTPPNKILYQKLNEYFEKTPNFSGNVLVAVNGKPIFRKCYGYADVELNVSNKPETKFRIGSVTKQFTAMAIMILQEQGKLNVTKKISDYLYDLPENWQEITIHQLLTHTSGLMHSWDLEGFDKTMMLYNSFDETINRFKDQPLAGKPGEKFHYSGVGYFLLSALIQKVSGKPYELFMKEEIFNKTGMENTGVDEPQKIINNRASGYVTDSSGIHNSTYIYMPILSGGGNLYSTMDDLLKWDQSLYKNILISEETKKKMLTPELDNYAYGWRVLKTDSLYETKHTGSVPGFSTLIDRYPDKGILIVVLSNNVREHNPETGREFSTLVLKELAEIGYNKK